MPDKYDKEDKKLIVREVSRVMKDNTFSQHHYKWEGGGVSSTSRKKEAALD